MVSNTDWGSGGNEGFTRDPNNEQITPLPANGIFTGQWTRVDETESFLILYGTHVPFSMQIQWSRDGITQDTDPFATITPQVRFRLGLYSVISPQSTFFRPFYRIKITNGPSPQFFVINDALLLKTQFTGYDIDVDGPIPVLGLARLGIGLQWARTPTGWEPQQLTALKNQKVALAENLLGTLPVALDNATLTALENIVVTLANAVSIDPVSLAALENITVGGTVMVANPPTDYPSTAILAKLETIRLLLASPVTPPGSSFVNLPLAGTTVIKSGPGVLRRVICNDPSLGITTLKLYNNTAASGPVIASIRTPGATNLPVEIGYDLAFSTGLTAVKVGLNDFTVTFT